MLFSINLFGQKITPSDSLVVVDIATIRKANEKLLERDYLLKVNKSQNNIISDYKILTEKQDSVIYKYQVENITLENKLAATEATKEAIAKQLDTRKKINYILSGVSVASLGILIINIIAK